MINNNIVLSNDSFDEYYSLKMINLQYNKLSVLPQFVFEHQTKLTFLLLLNNDLSVLETNAFYGLNSVKTLYLDNNYLKFLNLNSWKHMTNVKWINFGNNPIARVNSNIFKEMKDLSSLNINGINEENIDFSSFNNLTTRLDVLYLDEFHYCILYARHVKLCFPNIDVILWKHSSKFYGSNGLCYPLYIEDPFVSGWQYSAFMFLGLYAMSLLLMTILYALLFKNIKETRKGSKQISTDDFNLTVRFFFIVLANILCWSPIIVLKLAALRKYHISIVEMSQSSHPVSIYSKKSIEKNRKKALEEQRKEKNGTQENSLETTTEYEILSKLHNKETNQPESLLKSINTQLESINQEINNHYTFDKLNLIFNSIRNCAKHHLIGSETYAFGSRISGLALPNSDIDLYISIGNTYSCMKSRNMFKSYSLAWLVLFYLIIIHVIPPLMFLRRHADYSKSLTSDAMFIEDWDCTFCTLEKAKQIWRVPNISYFDFLFGFFNYYSDLNRLRKSVLYPIIGQVIPKSDLYNIPMKKNSEPLSETLRKLKNNFCGNDLALQDPLDLLNNITKRIRQKKLTMFSYLCNITMEGMKNRYLN
ncbi:hypothetical protein AGLY_012022 [Aphis glycines]|uniref:Uncharacterized protein n=1 Tax=Aphis glycines TaxID=307491 RepID=A0A6G0TCE6_APHGL|nr:hypothetical protein AGLY_012022 [Aphis glycines]